jgi:addiction module HigA family antidote
MMKNPRHSGQSFFVACLKPNGLSVLEGAKILKVARQTLSKLVNGKAGISTEMSIHIAKAFGGTPHGWYAMQAAYDLAQANKQAGKINVKPFKSRNGLKSPRTSLNA